MRILAAWLLALLFLSNPVSSWADQCGEETATAEGGVTGASAGGAACVYKGIPYAAPPVGELRWKPPQNALARPETMAAIEYGAECPQLFSKYTGGDGKSVIGSEDCLFLNIWRPQKSGVFPVMVWIHGGALIQGSGSFPHYQGDRLASDHDVVIVTINYRLGVLGFLSLPELAREDENGGAGNYGMLDQIKALEWVRDNIASFGGDPDNVTIFGESAGGWSVCNLLASPLSRGLFHKAIIESGGCDTVMSVDEGYEHGRGVAEAIGCGGTDAIDCLRHKTPEELFAGIPQPGISSLGKGGRLFSFIPKVDGVFLTQTPIEALRSGGYNNVPLIVGSTRDEMKFFSSAVPGFRALPPGLVKRVIGIDRFGEEGREFRRLYPWEKYRLPIDAVIDGIGDAGLGCANFNAAEASSAHQPATFYYRYDFDGHRHPYKIGAAHGMEIPFVFDHLDYLTDKEMMTKKQQAAAQPLADLTGLYWTNFARTGNPNGESLPEWPAYDNEGRMRMYFDIELSVRPAEMVEKCEYWSDKKSPI